MTNAHRYWLMIVCPGSRYTYYHMEIRKSTANAIWRRRKNS